MSSSVKNSASFLVSVGPAGFRRSAVINATRLRRKRAVRHAKSVNHATSGALTPALSQGERE